MPSTIDLLTFEAGGCRLALSASTVRYVVRAAAVSPLPQAPDIVEGVVNFHGTIVPVIDIRPRFGLPPRELTPDQFFMLADAGPRLVALRVDAVLELIQVSSDVVEPVGPVVPGARHVAGIARLADGLLVIQDLEQVLSLDEAAQLEAALERR